MRKKVGLLTLSVVGLGLVLSSCQYNKDPNQEWKDRALKAYNDFYAKPENQSLTKDPLFYFDIETFKGVLVRDPSHIEYLGQLNFSNFNFSENPNRYFVDFGNVPITFKDTDADGNPDNFRFGEYIVQDENGNTTFDVDALLNNLPFVLHEDDAGGATVETYSMVTDGGIIPETSNAKAYDPNFFFISDFSIQLEGFEEFTSDLLNFEGKDLAFLRNDLYSIIDSLLNQEDIQKVNEVLGLSTTLKNTYRRSVGIPLTQNMPTELYIPGTHYENFTDSKEVVVGPISFIPTLLEHFLPEIGALDITPSIYDVNTIYVGEGIKTIGFYAFYAERDSETGTSKSNLKNVYLPTTLESIQFNAFSDLDLENLYIPQTYTEVEGNKVKQSFETVDFGDASIDLTGGDEPLTLELTASFGNTSIQNIYFENYDNSNISSFPFSTIKAESTEALNESVKIYHGDYDLTKFDTLSTALEQYDAVNPFYQINLTTDEGKNKYSLRSDITSVAKGKKLYLPYFQYSLNTSEARNVVSLTNNENLSEEVEAKNAKLTLTLDKDLVIEGEVYIGAQIGRSKVGSGDIVGEFAALDLNGHKVTIKNGGALYGNGLIYDSTNNGEVIVENGGKLTTNLTVTSYKNFDETQSRAENGVNLFDSYKFNTLKVKTRFSAGSTLLTSLDLTADTFTNENTFEFIGNSSNSLLQLTQGELVLDSGTKSLVAKDSKVNINNVTLLTIEDPSSVSEESNEEYKVSEVGFNLANADLNVTLDEVTLNTFIRSESGNLSVRDLILNENAKVYSNSASNFTLLNSIEVSDGVTNSFVLGDVKVDNDTSLTDYLALVTGSKKASMSYSETLKTVSSDSNGVNLVSSVKNLRIVKGESSSEFERMIFKSNSQYYYDYSNSYNDGKLVDDNGTTLADYKNEGTWTAYNVENSASQLEEKVTNVSSKESNYQISSFSDDLSSDYVLNITGSRWNRTSEAKDGIYELDGKKYIKTSPNSPLIEGSRIKNPPSQNAPIFRSSSDNSIYVRKDQEIDDSWVKVESYDNYHVLKEVDSDTYYALIEGDEYTANVTYNRTQHVVTYANTNYAFVGDSFAELNAEDKIDESNKVISSQDGGYIFIDSKNAWEKVGALGSNVSQNRVENPSCYYFKINNTWLTSVDGTSYAFSYNELADYSFGVLADRYSYGGQRYKFVMKKGNTELTNNENFELFVPQGLVLVEKEDFSDLWPDGTDAESFHAYRHIERNGQKYLFLMDEEENITLKRFEFASGFTPTVPDPNNTNVLTKYNFIIYKVNFYNEDGSLNPNTQTIYVNVDSSNSNNAIYAGNSEDETSDEYLALAVFTYENPITVITE